MDKTNPETPTDTTAVLDKINNGDLKIIGKSEPKTEEPKKPKVKPEVVKPKPEKTKSFPADAKINDYGFLHFKNGLLENLGWTKGMALKVDKNADGSVTLRKSV